MPWNMRYHMFSPNFFLGFLVIIVLQIWKLFAARIKMMKIMVYDIKALHQLHVHTIGIANSKLTYVWYITSLYVVGIV